MSHAGLGSFMNKETMLKRIQDLEAQLKEKERARNAAQSGFASMRYIVQLAVDIAEDPAYELTGSDFDYEHPLHDLIRALHNKSACGSCEQDFTMSADVNVEPPCSECLERGCNGECAGHGLMGD